MLPAIMGAMGALGGGGGMPGFSDASRLCYLQSWGQWVH